MGDAILQDGDYLLLILQRDEEFFAGRKIVFRLGGLEADQTSTWQQGGATELHLTAVR